MNRRKLLLIEDSPTQATRLQRFFEADNLEVVQVNSAEAALEHMEQIRPDIIVLDYNLPGMNGQDLCRELRVNVNLRAIPVLMLTSEKGELAETQGLKSGADDYVMKSADPDILRFRVRSLLRKSDGTSAILTAESRMHRARLLLVDDSPTYLQYLEKELQSERYEIQTALRPADALTMLRSQKFDGVLVDFEMPELDGAAVCRRIRAAQQETDPEIILIVLSSHDDKPRMTAGFEAGADDYISKSADLSITKARIRALLRRRFLIEENRQILEEIKDKELAAMRARAERQAAEIRAEMADQLRAANEELDRANQELEHFAHAAAHDLQEPLRKIRIFSELLQRNYRDKLDSEGGQFLDFCIEGTSRMEQLIRDLLAYARVSRGPGESVAPQANLNAILETVRSNLQTAIAESGSEIIVESLPTLPVEEIRMQQLLQNLVANAIKYRRPDVVATIRIGAEKRQDCWVFSVSDNGMGIDPQYQSMIFRPFKRVHDDRSGTGLGLSMCKRIVESFGGRIWLRSEVDQGSTFFFSVPADAGADRSTAS